MRRFAMTLFVLGIVLPLYAQEPKQRPNPSFTRTEHMVTMRDGVKLNTIVHAPKESTENLPIIFHRTPYGVAGQNPMSSYTVDMARDGYIFVYQDIRGRHKSEGEFIMARPLRDTADPNAVDETTDTYDSIDWMVKNIKSNNGKVGMLGISYDGWTTAQGMIDPHPALKAVSPQAAMGDVYMGDDFYHNGAFRLSYGYEYCTMMETNKTQAPLTFDKADKYEWYLKLGSLSNVNEKYLKGKIPTWNNFVAHPNRDQFWMKRAVPEQLKGPKIPMMHVGGWWDQEDFYGPQAIYDKLEKDDKNNMNFMVMGPWNHGGWVGQGDRLGQIRFGSDTGVYFRTQVQNKWFAHYLKGGPPHNLPEVLTFKTGANEWVKNELWPPRNTEVKKLYFHANGKLSFQSPESTVNEEAFDSYISDPSKPVPYRARPIQQTYGPGSTWNQWLVADQRFVHNRPDVLSWETETLTEDVTIAGSAIAHLFASTTGSDADFAVKLIDVYAEDQGPVMGGFQLMVANEILRARFRNSFQNPEPFTPGKVESMKIELHYLHHCFKKGHKIMVQVQSTWFPLYDRNPQKFVPNIFEAKESDYIKAEHRVFRAANQASCVEVRVEK